MLWTLSVTLLVLWLVGLVSGMQVGAWIHVLLAVAMVTMLANLVRARA